ncbi:MAG TPA: hypothetical protein VGF82_05305 [Terracidiphilus sp.]|jgi:hypothetical protein
MEDLLGFIFELLFELSVQIALGEIVAGGYRSMRRFRVTARRGNPISATLILISIGLVLGLITILVFPHPLVHPSKLHGLSLLVSPVLTGMGMAVIGRGVRRRGRLSVRIESFGYGFAFAFAFAFIRFLSVR